MAKKSRAVRQYNKQIQRLNKINRKAQQKGLKVDLYSPAPRETKVQKKHIQELKQAVKKADKVIKEPVTKNTAKITQKQLAKAIQGRQKSVKPFKKVSPPKIPKTTKRVREDREDNVEFEYIPDEPEIPLEDTINYDADFYADAVIANFRESIKYYPTKAEPILSNWLDSLLTKYDKVDVAMMLQDGAEDGIQLSVEIAYNTEKLYGYISDMLDYLPEMEQWAKDDILESFETW